MRSVRGVLFLDYVRMLKAHKGVEWETILTPEDLPFLEQQIDKTAWYPMATFERMGNAILKFVAGDKMLPVQLWGGSRRRSCGARTRCCSRPKIRVRR